MRNKNLAPIVMFVYNRCNHTVETIDALAKNTLASESILYIYSDGPKNERAVAGVNDVRKYINSLKGKKMFKDVIIVESTKNKGLANSVIMGVTNILNKYKKIIVVEDDIVTSKNFLEYMNQTLDYYENNNKIWSISGYSFPIDIPSNYNSDLYLSYRGCSWGYATWKNRWDLVDWDVTDYERFKNSFKKRKKFNRGGNDLSQMLDLQMKGKIDSWAIRWCYSQFKNEMYAIYPVKSLVKNIGLDGSGTHSKPNKLYETTIKNNSKIKIEKDLKINKDIIKNFKKGYKIGFKDHIKEILICCKLYK